MQPTSLRVSRDPGVLFNSSFQQKKGATSVPSSSRHQKSSAVQPRQTAVSFLDEVLANSYRVEPTEWRCLVEVEAGALLWRFDSNRATTIFKGALAAMREILPKKESAPRPGIQQQSRAERFWFFIIRRIGALKPDLVNELLANTSGPHATPVKEDWTTEARAMISLAYDAIESDPHRAEQFAERTLSLGYVDWTGFLERLAKRDEAEAERLTVFLLQQLRNSIDGLIAMRNLGRFVLSAERSASLQDEFFRSISFRLQTDLQNPPPSPILTDDLSVAREMAAASARFPRWTTQFADLTSALEALFMARSLPNPAAPRTRTIDVSELMPAAPTDSSQIVDALPGIGAIPDTGRRDAEYERLAIRAAGGQDVRLAEDILSRIADEPARDRATLRVYGPLVRKAIGESNWPEAQAEALKIREPLGRTLVLDNIAQAMLQRREDKVLIRDLYLNALARLERDASNEETAKAYLVISRPLFQIDPERSTLAVQSAVAVMNQLYLKTGSIEERSLTAAQSSWVRLPNYSVQQGEVLDLTGLLRTVFREMARHDSDAAVAMAYRLSNWGLYSLAQLAVGEELIEKSNKPLPRLKAPKTHAFFL